MKGVVPPHLKDRFDYLDSLGEAEPPAPWRKVRVANVGGLSHVGFPDGSELLLAVSLAGRGVFDCRSGERLARDDDEYYAEPGLLQAEGIGPLQGQTVRVAGNYGGGLARTTPDGWCIELHPLSWPDEVLFLCPPHQTMLWNPESEAPRLTRLPGSATPVVAFGFSSTGLSLVVATSSDITIYARAS